MKRPALLLPVLVSALFLAACNSPEAPADAATSAETAAGTTASDGPSAEAQAAAASAAAAEGAALPDADPADADADTAAEADTSTPDPVPGLVEGKDYEVIRNGQPWQPLNGKVEVVEVFGYVCPACARIEPIFSGWEERLPADVRVNYVRAPFGPQWTPYAKAFYVAESLGLVDETHTPMFHAIHLENTLPGEGETPDEDAIAQWYGKHGADA